jgi:type II secretory pathway pseudopilin PulG
MTRIAASLVVLVVLGGLGSAAEQRAREDNVAETMLTMRTAGTVIDVYRQEFGSYPGADGQLRPLKEAFRAEPPRYRKIINDKDAWGQPLFYRANSRSYVLISFGADRAAEQDYEGNPIIPGRTAQIIDAAEPTQDLVMADGRFVQRPFGDMGPAFDTINAMNRVFVAAASFAVDNNRYPGDASTFVPVVEIASDLIPAYTSEVPSHDGWGRPILYFNNGSSFVLASFGPDGEPDRPYYPDLACGLMSFDATPSIESDADVVQANGEFVYWPRGVEP